MHSSEHLSTRQWVVANWDKWIYPDCEISQVLVINSYKPGSHSFAEVQELPVGNLQSVPPRK
nr:Imm45 family immunity protein [Pseudomonas rubra]